MSANADPLIQLDKLSIVFEQKTGLFSKPLQVGAVVDVDLDIFPGEIVALVGESGCGKTTLGKAVTGLMKPTAGTIRYNGRDIYEMNKQRFHEYRDAVQMVHQDSYAALNPSRTIFQSLSAPLLQKKLAKSKNEAMEKVCELLETVELNPPELFLEKFPHQLSGGQRQRVLIARAISLSPKLIMADEPISMVDMSLRISILNLMSRLNKQLGIAFLYITHDLATARYLAQNGRIAVMYLGKIVELGKVQDVLARPRHPYLQALMSAVPVPDPEIAKAQRLLPLKSLEMPSPAHPPSGCRFHPRCPYAEASCEREQPPLAKDGDRLTACHLVDRLPAWSIGAGSFSGHGQAAESEGERQ